MVAHEILKTAQRFPFPSLDLTLMDFWLGLWIGTWNQACQLLFFVATIFAERRLFLDNEYFNIRLGFRVNVAFSDTKSFKL